MATKKTGNPVGRPDKPIDWDYVDNLLRAGVSGTSIAAMIGIHEDTLYKRTVKEFPEYANFSAYSAAKRAQGLDLLRAKQYDVAMKGDRTMLVWLGKQYLGQTDKVEQNVDATLHNEPIIGIIVK